MSSLIHEVEATATPDSVAAGLVHRREPSGGLVLLRSGGESSRARYSLVTANPFLIFRSRGSRCEITRPGTGARHAQFGDPWKVLEALMPRYELLDGMDLPFPLGGCFGFWGYDLKNFTEPKLPRRALNDLELPDCHVGFYDSVVIFDHALGKTFVVSTGLDADGSRSGKRANARLDFWKEALALSVHGPQPDPQSVFWPPKHGKKNDGRARSNVTRQEYVEAVKRAQRFIRAGDIYQVNLSQRLTAPLLRRWPGWW
ncbi:MAG: hypothetical protein ACRED1_06810 [Limisphaerales bacterium]